MKLLDKKTIVDQRSLERKREIDEGVKLAKKVDQLRQTASEEEANLSKFRIESLKQLKTEVAILVDQRDSLSVEINTLRHKVEKLKMLPDLEWDKITKEAEYLAGLKKKLEEQEFVSMGKEIEIARREELLMIERGRIEDERARVKNELIKNKETFEKNATTEIQLNNKLTQTNAYVREKENELLEKELKIAALERDLVIKEETIAERSLYLNNREKFINDKYQTLLRTEKRIKN